VGDVRHKLILYTVTQTVSTDAATSTTRFRHAWPASYGSWSLVKETGGEIDYICGNKASVTMLRVFDHLQVHIRGTR
jgi:hypothetical protein